MRRNLFWGILSVFSALGTSLAFYQLIPGEKTTAKTSVFLIGILIVSFIIFRFILLKIQKHYNLSVRTLFINFLISSLISLLLIFVFHLSFPQKMIILPERTITFEVQGAADTNLSFLSLNNGYEGVGLSDFETDGDWKRVEDRLILETTHQPAALHFSGKVGRNVAAFFKNHAGSLPLTINWGDGTAETITLSESSLENNPQMIRHDFGTGTGLAEKANFFLNLYSVWSLITWLLFLYSWLLLFMLKKRSRRFRLAFFMLTAFTLLIRITNVYNFPLGWDEGTYSRAAMRYAEKALAFKWAEIPEITYNHEHPAFVKLMFAVPAVIDGRDDWNRFGWADFNRAELGKEDYTIFTGRMVSAVFSLWTVQALILLIHPLAGFFFIIHSLAAEYGAQARLEAIPMLFSFLSVWLFWRALQVFKIQGKIPRRKMIFSAILLGLTAASKIIYCVVAFAMAAAAFETFLTIRAKRAEIIKTLGLMTIFSLATFFIFNPSLWYDPQTRLMLMLGFHDQYQMNARAIYPWWQPILWVTRSVVHQSDRYFIKNPLARKPEKFFFSADELIFLLAVVGFSKTFRERRIFVYWFLFGMIFLFAWGTKWEQYACVVTIPICIAAYEGVIQAVRWLFPEEKKAFHATIESSANDK